MIVLPRESPMTQRSVVVLSGVRTAIGTTAAA